MSTESRRGFLSKVGLALAGVGVLVLPRRAQASYAEDRQSHNGGRLTLTTAVPVTVADVTSGTLFWAPYKSSLISLISNGKVVTLASAEVSISLTSISTTAPTDVFGFFNAGVLALELLVWTNDTTRATGLTAPSTTVPFYFKAGDSTRRYLGTVYGSAANTVADTEANRYVWNVNNRVAKRTVTSDATASWTHAVNSFAAMNSGAAAWRVDFVRGQDEDPIDFSASCTNQKATGGAASVAVGLDSTTAVSADCTCGIPVPGSNPGTFAPAHYLGNPGIGKHFLSALQGSDDASTATYYGTVARRQEGVTCLIVC